MGMERLELLRRYKLIGLTIVGNIDHNECPSI